MIDPARVRRLAIEAADRVRRRSPCRDSSPSRALLRPIFTCSARYTWPMPPSPSFLQHVVPVGDDRADQVVLAPCDAQRRAVLRTEALRSLGYSVPHCGQIFSALTRSPRAGSGRRRGSAGPSSAARSPRTAIATPFRLPASCTKNSLSSDTISACLPLIVWSYGNIQSPVSRPISTDASRREMEDVADAAVGAQLLEDGDVHVRRHRAHAARRVGFRRMRTGIAEPAEAEQLRSDEHQVAVGQLRRLRR